VKELNRPNPEETKGSLMAGQGLLGGCNRPWTHDCTGFEPGASDDGPFGGVVCHCPCHRLERQLAELRELVSVGDARGGRS
jgi:hypothetical protein